MVGEQVVAGKILVTGATGNQGGAVAHALLARGVQVRALTRDPNKPKARVLTGLGAELIQGDLDDPAAVARAVSGVSGVFAVQNFFEAGYEGEIRQGVALADAARAAGVDHFVFSSVASADCGTGIPHFESKKAIEDHVSDLPMPWTILRPVFLMQNWEALRSQILSGTLAQPLAPKTVLQQVAAEDVGAFATMAFLDRERWEKRVVELAGDERPVAEVAAALGRAAGRHVQYVQIPLTQFQDAAGEELASMYRWLDEAGYAADVAARRADYPGLTSLERYLDKHGWRAATATGSSGANELPVSPLPQTTENGRRVA